jgi:hypothetical protein
MLMTARGVRVCVRVRLRLVLTEEPMAICPLEAAGHEIDTTV